MKKQTTKAPQFYFEVHTEEVQKENQKDRLQIYADAAIKIQRTEEAKERGKRWSLKRFVIT